MRYVPGKYADCRFCRGRGCPACDAEADKDYKAQFPDGPKPIFTAHIDNPDEMAELKRVFGRESLEKAFGEGGGGMQEILQKLKQKESTHVERAF